MEDELRMALEAIRREYDGPPKDHPADWPAPLKGKCEGVAVPEDVKAHLA